MVTFIVQGIITLQKGKLAPVPLVESLKQTVAAGNYQEAWEICNANKNYLANVLKAALTRVGRGSEVVEEAIIEHGQREATLLRTRNSYLSVIGVISPMIGLLGTVIGMIGAFTRARAIRHLRSARALGQDRRGALRDRERPLHRHPGVHFLLRLPQHDLERGGPCR